VSDTFRQSSKALSDTIPAQFTLIFQKKQGSNLFLHYQMHYRPASKDKKPLTVRHGGDYSSKPLALEQAEKPEQRIVNP